MGQFPSGINMVHAPCVSWTCEGLTDDRMMLGVRCCLDTSSMGAGVGVVLLRQHGVHSGNDSCADTPYLEKGGGGGFRARGCHANGQWLVCVIPLLLSGPGPTAKSLFF